MRRIRGAIVLLCLFTGVFLSGCGIFKSETQKKEEILREKGIEIVLSEDKKKEDSYKKFVANLDIFFTDFEATDAKVFVSTGDEGFKVPDDLALSFDDYFSLYVETLGGDYDYGISMSTVSNILNQDTIDEGDLAKFLRKEENTYILDFTRPLTEDILVSKETAEYTKNAARAFCGYIKETYGFNKLKDLSKSPENDEEKTRLKNEWLKSIGVETEYVPAASFFFIKNEGEDREEYPYYIESKSYDLFIASDVLNDQDYREYFKYYQISSQYWEEDLKNAREVFYGYDKELPKINMYLHSGIDKVGETYKAGAYAFNKGIIDFYGGFWNAVQSFQHEYTHYMEFESDWRCKMYNRFKVLALIEGYTVVRDHYEYKHKSQEKCDKTIEQSKLWNAETMSYRHDLFWEMYAYWLNVRPGVKYISVCYQEQETSDEIKDYWDLSYEQLGSLIHFLKIENGDEALNKAFADPDKFELLFDGDYEGVYRRWQEYVRDMLIENGITEEFILEWFDGNK